VGKKEGGGKETFFSFPHSPLAKGGKKGGGGGYALLRKKKKKGGGSLIAFLTFGFLAGPGEGKKRKKKKMVFCSKGVSGHGINFSLH